MSNEITKRPQNNEIASAWGDREEIGSIAKRLRAMLPNGQRMTEQQLFAAAQYAQLTGLDPFSGGFYAMPGGGVHNHYATIVAWAQDKASYSERFEKLTDEELLLEGHKPADVVAGWKCYVVRDDRAQLLGSYAQSGMPFQQALEFVAAKGVGIVTQADVIDRKGRKYDAPKTWTWEKVAQKRALVDALKHSHGKPSARELARIEQRLQAESPQARIEAIEAQVRRIVSESDEMSPDAHRARLVGNVALMRGDDSAIGEGEDACENCGIDQDPADLLACYECGAVVCPNCWGEDACENCESDGDSVEVESAADDPDVGTQTPSASIEPPDDPDVGGGKMAAPVQQLFDRVQAATNGYYKNAPHLANAIGGWPDFNDPDDIDAKLSAAVDHVQRKFPDDVQFAMELAAPGGGE